MFTDTFLANKSIQIFKDNKQIINDKEEEFYPKNNTKVQVGQHLLNEEDYDITKIDYRKLLEFNIHVAFIQEQKPFSTVIQTFYYLAYNESQAEDYGMLPKEHSLEFDSFTRAIRLIGPKVQDGRTDWLPVDRKKNNEELGTKERIIKDALRIRRNLYPIGTFNKKNVFMDIPDMAIGISTFGELVCIPETPDAPRIGIAGESGSGKTFTFHRLKDCMIDKNYARIIEINDRKMENGEYVLTWDDTRFGNNCINQLSKINEISKPLPMLFLHPINNSLTDRSILHKDTLGFSISLPFKELIKNTDMFECYYDLGKSGHYIQNIINDLSKCKTLEEMDAIIDSETQGKKNPTGKIPFQSSSKIKTFLANLYKTKIFDISNGVNASWKININSESTSNYPWIVGLISGLSVAIETSHIVKEPYYPAMLKFFLENIFYEKKINPLLKNERLIIFADEIPDLVKNKAAFQIINEVIRTGRSDGVGFCMAVQYYEDILPEVRTNLSHFFIFKQKIDNKGIKRDFFQQYPEMGREMMNLKNRECIACGDFILYNPITGKRYPNNGSPMKMKLLPPNSRHHGPPEVRK